MPVGDIETVAAAGADWVRRILGPEAAVSLASPDRSGRLRVVWADGLGANGLWARARRWRAAKRRAAFESLGPTRLRLGDDERVVAMLPLVCRGEAVGVLEVLAPEPRVDDAWDLLESCASQLGVALQAVTQNARLRLELETLERASSLGAALVRAGTGDEAVRVAVRLVWERFRVPVAGWYGVGGGQLELVGLHGLGARNRRELRGEMSTLTAWGSLEPAEREAVKRRFQELTGARHVSALGVGDALLLEGGPSASTEGSLEVVGSLLAEVLRLLDTAALADMRNQRLDLGIAWTAHEIRGPLLGIRAALDLLLERGASDPSERAVLRTSLQELDQLTMSAEAILTWAVGERPLHLEEADLVRIVEEAVESCRLEAGYDKDVVVFAPERAVARFDATHLRMVVSNLVRNALAYSFRGTKVEVVVEDAGDHLALSVKDEGPEIPVEERRLIFDPFARGSVSGSARNGTGLGLFIARRVVEAHGGRIWVDSDVCGTAFHVRLPVEGRSLQRHAS